MLSNYVVNVKRIIRILLVSALGFAPLLSAPLAFAASATMSLSPSSSSVTNGSTITVSIYENSGAEPVNAAKAVISYPASLLDFVSISSSSAFAIVATNSGGGGSVQIDRGALPAVSGNQLVASVRFKAKASAGTAAVSLVSGSSVVSANSNTNIVSGLGGANYTLKAPVAAPPAAPAPPPPPKDTTAPTLKDVVVSDISTNSAVISWTTSEPATSEVNYGINTGYGLAGGDNNFVTAHKVILSSALLSPGVKYHFVVKSVDPSGNAVSGNDQTFKTKGVPLAVTVVNQNKKAVKGAKVTLGDSTGTTDKNGRVTLSDLPEGKLVGTVTYKGKDHVVNVEVKTPDPKATAPQSATFTIKTPGTNLLIILLPLILILLLVGAWVMRKRNKKLKDLLGHFPTTGSGTSGGTKVGGSSTPSSTGAFSSSAASTGSTVIKPTTKN
jgi:hypothetical protein